ncbi:MAG TPA: hypothetical protein VLM85_27380, partial [Polyangiaceae bacterium]|nr:hypothetical protein [Polyangiaceae bacterium]
VVSAPEPAKAPAPVAAAPTPAAAPVAAPPAAAPAAAPAAEAAPSAAPAKSSLLERIKAQQNTATAELEKSDPRHANARRLARLFVSEIKLYHEDAVRLGKANNDLYERLFEDIALSRQNFQQRVPGEVREKFDYLYDEIVRQLCDGDAAKLGPKAPKPNPPRA